jgi:hypothetical protein
MHARANDETIRIFRQFMATAEGAALQDAKDAACNMLASILSGVPEWSIAEAERQVDLCCRDIKKAIRANWHARKPHQRTQ